MKFGVNVLNFGPYATPSQLLGWARFAEETGFHSAMISDHIAVTPDVAQPYPAPFYDPFTTLAWFAGQTERIELGTTVAVLPYRSPLQTARVVANLDQISGGRAVLGVGIGWSQQEYAALNVPYERRGAVTDEYLGAIRELWTKELASYKGEFVDFTDVSTAPLPVRDPHPPVWIGGQSGAAIRRAVRFGTHWHPIDFTVAWLRDTGLPAVRAEAGAQGRPVPGLAPRLLCVRLTDEPLPDDERRPGQGTLEQIHGDLAALRELGAEHVLFDTYQGTPGTLVAPEKDFETLRVLADQVIDLEGETLR